MTRGVRISNKAERDADDIAYYIAQDSLDAALRFYDAIENAYQRIGEHAEMYPEVPFDHPAAKNIRKHVVEGFPVIVLYRIDADMVDISRVYHGARDIPQAIIEDLLEGD